MAVVSFVYPIKIGLWVSIARPAAESHLLSSAVTVTYWATEYWLAIASLRAGEKRIVVDMSKCIENSKF